MTSPFPIAVLLLAALGSAACAARGTDGGARPRGPDQERVVRGPRRPDPPPLIAPPPAYGNKIVMAQRGRGTTN